MNTAKPLGDWLAKKRVTLVGALANSGLVLAKFTGGVLGQSQALIADAVHSLSDLVSDALVLLAARWGSEDADENHPYGHARIETVSTVMIGGLLMAVALGFVLDAVGRLSAPERLLQPGWLALTAALLSVAVKEWLFRFTRKVALQTQSPLIEANAWHHRSDALSSLVVIAGVAGAMVGFVWLDAVAAIVVALMVAWVGWRLIAQSVAELIDTGLDEARLALVDEIILSVDGVHAYRQLRTRRMAGQAYMDVQIYLDASLRLDQADTIAREVRRRLLDGIPEMKDVVVGIRPQPN